MLDRSGRVGGIDRFPLYFYLLLQKLQCMEKSAMQGIYLEQIFPLFGEGSNAAKVQVSKHHSSIHSFLSIYQR